MKLAWPASFAFLAACSGAVPATPDLSPTPDLAPVPDLAPPHSGIGDPCTGSGFQQGSCSAGQICVDPTVLPGGYCTSQCPCPSDSTCVTVPQGDFCFVNCVSSADCRTPDYVCSPQHVCFPAGGMQGDGVTPG